jgi:hypothetical protein
VKNFDELLSTLLGGFIACWLNITISPEFFRSASLPNMIYSYGILAIIFVLFFVCFRMHSTSSYRKGKTLMLGASMVSFIFASSSLIIIFLNYLASVQPDAPPGTFYYFQPIVIFSLFRSIFLASLFGTIERVIEFLEKKKEAK